MIQPWRASEGPVNQHYKDAVMVIAEQRNTAHYLIRKEEIKRVKGFLSGRGVKQVGNVTYESKSSGRSYRGILRVVDGSTGK